MCPKETDGWVSREDPVLAALNRAAWSGSLLLPKQVCPNVWGHYLRMANKHTLMTVEVKSVRIFNT